MEMKEALKILSNVLSEGLKQMDCMKLDNKQINKNLAAKLNGLSSFLHYRN